MNILVRANGSRRRIFIIMLVLLSGLNVNFKVLLGNTVQAGKIISYLVYLIRGGVVLYFLFFLVYRNLTVVSAKYFFYYACLITLNTLAIVNGTGDLAKWIHRTLSMGYLWVYYSCIIRFAEKSKEELLEAMYFISAFLLLDSFLLYCLQPEIATHCESSGVYTLQGVAGNRNHLIEYWILETVGLFGSEKLCDNRKYRGVWLFTIWIQCLTKSGTGIVVMAAAIFMLLIYNKKRKLFKLALFANYIVILVVYVVMVFNQKLMFEHIIVNVLHKSPTLTGRFGLWEANLKNIMKYPILGYGYDNALKYGAIDNSVLYLLMAGGSLGFIIWIYMLVSSHSTVIHKKAVNKTQAVLCIGVLAYMVRSITEAVVSYPHIVFWCSLIMLDIEKYNKTGLELNRIVRLIGKFVSPDKKPIKRKRRIKLCR